MEHAEAERRGEQRYPLRLPVLVRSLHGCMQEQSSLTKDVSARGVFFYVDRRLVRATAVELILTLPAEITLTESIQVRCRGRVSRVVSRSDGSNGVAVVIEQYHVGSASDQSCSSEANA
jgi:PilZ domain-containing protein